MRKIIILVGVIGASVVGHAQQQLDPSRPDDRPFDCGAVFAIDGQAYSDAGKAAEAEKFRARFQRLESLAEAEFARRGLTKQDAHRYMQKQIDASVVAQSKEPRLVADFVRWCEVRFPN